MLPQAGRRVKRKMQVERAATAGVYFPTPFLMDKSAVWPSTIRP